MKKVVADACLGIEVYRLSRNSCQCVTSTSKSLALELCGVSVGEHLVPPFSSTVTVLVRDSSLTCPMPNTSYTDARIQQYCSSMLVTCTDFRFSTWSLVPNETSYTST